MPNFFKKLTGSLKMPDEEELFSDDELKQDNTSQPQPQSEAEDYSSGDGPREDFEPEEDDSEEEISEEEELENEMPESPDEEAIEETFQNQDENEEEEMEDDQESIPTEIPTEEERPNSYTIAQLARATTAKKQAPKKSSGGGALSRLKSLKKEKEGEERIEPEGQLAIDVFETPTHIIIKSTIAGVKAEDLDVGIEDNVVNIRGSRHREEKAEDVDYFYQECYWGTFSRSVILPVEVDADKAEASLSNGVLTLKIPKILKEKEKKIKVVE